MRALHVVLTAPALEEDLGFVQRIEEFPIQQLIPQLLGDAELPAGICDPDTLARLSCPGSSVVAK